MRMKKDKGEKIKLNRLKIMDNCIFFHGHLLGYIACILALCSVIFLNIYPLIGTVLCCIPEGIYLIDLLIGRAYKVNGEIINKKSSVIFSDYKINEADNECRKLFVKNEKGNIIKMLCYDKTRDVSYGKKARIKKGNAEYRHTYYYLPISKVVVDIDYKCISK